MIQQFVPREPPLLGGHVGKQFMSHPFMFLGLEQTQHRGQEGVEKEACNIALDARESLAALHLGSSMLIDGLPRKGGPEPFIFVYIREYLLLSLSVRGVFPSFLHLRRQLF